MKIYGFPTFNVMKVLLTAEELELDYEYVNLDPAKGEHKTAEYLAVHPLGKVPALEHDGETFIESNSICRYLASVGDSTLYQGGAKQKAHIDQWVDLVTQHIGRWLAVFFFQELVKKNLLQQDVDQAAIQEAQEFLDQQLPLMEQQLGKSQYLAGDTLTIADTVAFSYLCIHEATSANIDSYSNIQRWYQQIKASPAYQRASAYVPLNPFA